MKSLRVQAETIKDLKELLRLEEQRSRALEHQLDLETRQVTALRERCESYEFVLFLLRRLGSPKQQEAE